MSGNFSVSGTPKIVLTLLSMGLLGLLGQAVAAPTRPALWVQGGHNGWVNAVAFSPDGKWLASGGGDELGNDTTVKLWDAGTGRIRLTLKGHRKLVSSVAFSPDGKRLASGSDDQTVKVWDPSTGRLLSTLKGHVAGVEALAYSPDGKRLASTSGNAHDWLDTFTRHQEDNTIKVWNTANGQLLGTLRGHVYGVKAVVFSPDGRLLASGGGDGTVKLWNAAERRGGADLPFPYRLKGHSSPVGAVAFSPDGKRLASGSWDRTVKVWDPSTGQLIRTLEGHTGPIGAVAFSPDGKRLASGSWDRTVKVWDPSTGQLIRTLEGHTGPIGAVAFSPDGKRLASGSWDRTVKLWNVAMGGSGSAPRVITLQGQSRSVRSLAFRSDGKLLAIGLGDEFGRMMTGGRRVEWGSEDSTVKLWDPERGQILTTIRGITHLISSIAFSRDGTKLATSGPDRTARLWNVANAGEQRSVLPGAILPGHADWVSAVAFSPDGTQLASGSWDGTVKLWAYTGTGVLTPLKTLQKPWMLSLLPDEPWHVLALAYSFDGKWLASGNWDHTVKVWDPSTGGIVRVLAGHGRPVSAVTFSPDGKRLASGSLDRTVKLWDMTTGRILGTLEGHANRISSLAFSPDGKRLASGSYDQTVRLWDVEREGMQRGVPPRAVLKGHTGSVTSVAFSPDGERLVSGSLDHTVKLWNARTGADLLTLVFFDQGDWVVFTPDGRCDGTPSSSRYISWKVGNRYYPFPQFNREYHVAGLWSLLMKRLHAPVRKLQNL